MSGGVVRHVFFGVPNLSLRRFRAFPLRGELPQSPSTRARAYVRRPHHLSSNFKASLPSLPAPAFSSVAFLASSSWARSGFVNWYLGVLAARPVLTKSLTAAAITVAADLFSQVPVISHWLKILSFRWICREFGRIFIYWNPQLISCLRGWWFW